MTRVGVVPGRPGVLVADLEAAERDFHRLSGRWCLDLATTVGERWRRNFERLVEPADLDRWIEGAGLATPGAGPASSDDLALARRLRDAVHVLACEAEDAGQAERPPRYPTAAVAAVGEVAALAPLVPVLRPDAGRAWAVPDGEPATSAALATVARDAIDLFSSARATRVRHCAAPDCALVFLDTSRGGRRRWCSMSGCGNRAKQRAHRERTS